MHVELQGELNWEKDFPYYIEKKCVGRKPKEARNS